MYEKLKPTLYILLTALSSMILSIILRFAHCPIASVMFSIITGAILFVAILFFIVTIINNFLNK